MNSINYFFLYCTINVYPFSFAQVSANEPFTPFISVRALQFKNVPSPIAVTLLGIVILVKLMHPKNAIVPILVTLFGITILTRLIQPKNAPLAILVALSGTMAFLYFLQFLNALSPIPTTLFDVFIPICTSDVIISVRSVHSSNALFPI